MITNDYSIHRTQSDRCAHKKYTVQQHGRQKKRNGESQNTQREEKKQKHTELNTMWLRIMCNIKDKRNNGAFRISEANI